MSVYASAYQSEDPDEPEVTVVQIDTEASEHVRVYLNEGLIWDGTGDETDWPFDEPVPYRPVADVVSPLLTDPASSGLSHPHPSVSDSRWPHTERNTHE